MDMIAGSTNGPARVSHGAGAHQPEVLAVLRTGVSVPNELSHLADAARVAIAIAGASAALLLAAAASAALPRSSEVLLEGRGWALASLAS